MFVRCSCSSRFLSTLSLRRATRGEIHANSQQEFLSTLSLRRATINVYHRIFGEGISIHALLAESDPKSFRGRRCPANFYPRSPCGERRNATGHGPDGRLFLSTLSLRRATVTGSESQKLILHFYPRSPCGERLGAPVERMPSSSISIHALLAESDFNNGVALVPHQQISIHALLAESDSQWRTLASGM